MVYRLLLFAVPIVISRTYARIHQVYISVCLMDASYALIPKPQILVECFAECLLLCRTYDLVGRWPNAYAM